MQKLIEKQEVAYTGSDGKPVTLTRLFLVENSVTYDLGYIEERELRVYPDKRNSIRYLGE
jgi:hypothetical protein